MLSTRVFVCDVLQVKVWLGDNADHYYVLSRFLLSRMLTVTKVFDNLNFVQYRCIFLQVDICLCLVRVPAKILVVVLLHIDRSNPIPLWSNWL